MALVKDDLEQAIRGILDVTSEIDDDPEDARDYFAIKLAQAIYDFVKSGEVNVTVSTTGTATAQNGTGTGTIN